MKFTVDAVLVCKGCDKQYTLPVDVMACGHGQQRLNSEFSPATVSAIYDFATQHNGEVEVNIPRAIEEPS